MYCEDWGEGLTNKSVPAICVVNLQTGEVTVLQGVPEDISPGQVRTERPSGHASDTISRSTYTYIDSEPTELLGGIVFY